MTLNLPDPCSSRALLKDGPQINTGSTIYVFLEYKRLVLDALLQFQPAKNNRQTNKQNRAQNVLDNFTLVKSQILTFLFREGVVAFDCLFVLKLFLVGLESFGLSWLCLNTEGL